MSKGSTSHAGCTQKNGAFSKGNKEFISHFTRAQRTPSSAETVQVSHALPAVRFSCLMRGSGASFQDGVAAGKDFCVLHFEVSRSVITVQREFRARFRKDAPCIDDAAGRQHRPCIIPQAVNTV